MARAILRWSVSGEKNNATGLAVRKTVEQAGFERRGTGSWEADGPGTSDLIDALQQALDDLRAAPGGGRVDHVWIYLDDFPNN